MRPRKLTWIPKMKVWKMHFLLKMAILGIYVAFLGCRFYLLILGVGGFQKSPPYPPGSMTDRPLKMRVGSVDSFLSGPDLFSEAMLNGVYFGLSPPPRIPVLNSRFRSGSPSRKIILVVTICILGSMNNPMYVKHTRSIHGHGYIL